jgi:hypothetical protein
MEPQRHRGSGERWTSFGGAGFSLAEAGFSLQRTSVRWPQSGLKPAAD